MIDRQFIIGMTSGCWDLLHTGHIYFLNECAKQCNILLVGVDSDDLIRSKKGNTRPITPLSERITMLQNLRLVDMVFTVKQLEDLDYISRTFNVHKVFKNQAFEKRTDVYGVTNRNAELVIIQDFKDLPNTTGIIERIKNEA